MFFKMFLTSFSGTNDYLTLATRTEQKTTTTPMTTTVTAPRDAKKKMSKSLGPYVPVRTWHPPPTDHDGGREGRGRSRQEGFDTQ
jgi:hypothetical protein